MSVIDTLLAHPVRVSDSAPASKQDAPALLVACSDPSHSPRLLALTPPGSIVVRAPGPVLTPDGELARAIVSTAILHGCKEIVVLAHSGCALASADTSGAFASLTRAGLSRASIPGDVRAFFNLHPSPRQLALDGARALRAMSCLPPEFRVHALLLEETTGEFSVVERDENATLRASPASAEGPTTRFGGELPAGLGVGIEARLANAPGPVDMGPGIAAPAPALGMTLEALPTMPLPAPTPVPPVPTLEEGLSALSAGRTESPPTPPAPTLEEGLSALTAGRAEPQPATPARPAPKAAPPPALRSKKAAPPRRPPPSGGSGSSPPRAFPPEMASTIERVRDFYRGEIEPRQRREIVQALQRAASAGAGSPELLRIVLKPVLDLGPKRYKVLDELLAVKQAGLEMEPDALQALLRHVLD